MVVGVRLLPFVTLFFLQVESDLDAVVSINFGNRDFTDLQHRSSKSLFFLVIEVCLTLYPSRNQAAIQPERYASY